MHQLSEVEDREEEPRAALVEVDLSPLELAALEVNDLVSLDCDGDFSRELCEEASEKIDIPTISHLVQSSWKRINRPSSYDRRTDLSEILRTDRNIESLRQHSPIDWQTNKFLELHALWEGTYHFATTHSGKIAFYQTLISPPADIRDSQIRQDAIKALDEDLQLRKAIEDVFAVFARIEKTGGLFEFISNGTDYNRQQLVLDLLELRASILAIPFTEDPHLEKAMAPLREFASLDLTKKNLSPWLTPLGFVGKDFAAKAKVKLSLSDSTLRSRLALGTMVPSLIGPIVYGTMLGVSLSSGSTNNLMNGGACGFIASALVTAFGVFGTAGALDDKFAKKWHDILISNISPSAARGLIDAIGSLDELMAFQKLPSLFEDSTFPLLDQSKEAVFEATDLGSTMLAMQGASCRPYSFAFYGGKLVVLTGPNSGGKSTFALSLHHAKLLALCGSKIFAKSARLTGTAFLSHQGPMMSPSADAEGRFGFEGNVTLGVIRRGNAFGLNQLLVDEAAQGTNPDEALRHGRNFGHAFNQMGGITFLITQDPRLAQLLESEGIADCYQFVFKDGRSTFELIPGIATESHSDAVAERVGFHLEGLNHVLAEKGVGPILPVDEELFRRVSQRTDDNDIRTR